jgi:hypothetical protein
MFITTSDLIAMTICAAVSLGMLILLFIANYTLLKQNRYLKSRLQAWRQSCQHSHVEVPF